MEFSGGMQDGILYNAKIVAVSRNGLKCRLTCSNREGFISGILYNAKERRLFMKGDDVQIICTSVGQTVEYYLTKEYVRPLLIFDMHGVLGERVPFEQRSKNGKRRFVRRPFVDEFIEFCSQHFEIAVWSCGMKKNLDLKMFENKKLLFCWCQDQSTNLYPRVSSVSSHKPLFLKELSQVWKQFPSFDASNTLLLDNHVEKCERNPLGTCLIVPDFLLESTDDRVLHLEEAVAQHLLAMSANPHPGGGPVNIQTYLTSRAGSDDMFPISYQTHLTRLNAADTDILEHAKHPHDADKIRAEAVAAATAREITIDTDAPWETAESEYQRAMESVASTIISTLKEKPKELSGRGGERALLVATPFHGGEIYFVCRDMSIQTLDVKESNNLLREELAAWLRSLTGVTILDGDITTERNFTWINAIMLNGNVFSDDKTADGAEDHGSSEYDVVQNSRSLVSAWLMCSPLDDISFEGDWRIHT